MVEDVKGQYVLIKNLNMTYISYLRVFVRKNEVQW